MRRDNGSKGTPLDPPVFWLDNIFNLNGLVMFYTKSCNKHADYGMPLRDMS